MLVLTLYDAIIVVNNLIYLIFLCSTACNHTRKLLSVIVLIAVQDTQW